MDGELGTSPRERFPESVISSLMTRRRHIRRKPYAGVDIATLSQPSRRTRPMKSSVYGFSRAGSFRSQSTAVGSYGRPYSELRQPATVRGSRGLRRRPTSLAKELDLDGRPASQ